MSDRARPHTVVGFSWGSARYPPGMDKEPDEVSAEPVDDDLTATEKLEAERRAQQHDYFRKRDVWPRG